MVRTLVGTMVEVGRGKRSLGDFTSLLERAPRGAAGRTAPAYALFLWDIRYARHRKEKALCGRIPGEDGTASSQESAVSEV